MDFSTNRVDAGERRRGKKEGEEELYAGNPIMRPIVTHNIVREGSPRIDCMFLYKEENSLFCLIGDGADSLENCEISVYICIL